MFPPENDEGNVEYKRHLCSDELGVPDDNYNIRFQQLVTQLKYRLSEGSGIALYYIGVEDDGSLYELSSKQSSKSISILKKMAFYIDAKITDVVFKNKYIKVIIKDKNNYSLYPEKRILLLGDTETGKTTFLAYLIKDKVDTINCKSRLYILNHKHELESGKSSSFNYQSLIHKGIKYVFIDTPGDDELFSKNSKTRNKTILSFQFDLVLFFEKENDTWEKRKMYNYYFKLLNIPYLDLNLFNEKEEINLINPIPKTIMLELLNMNIQSESFEINFPDTYVNFYLLQAYPHVDMGWVLSGFLQNGKLEIGQELYWYEYDKLDVKINSIHINNVPVSQVNGPATVTITLMKINKITNKPRFGFLSNINYFEIDKVKIIWIYFNDTNVIKEKELIIYVKNQSVTLKKVGVNYKITHPNHCYNLINKYFFYEKENINGFGKISSHLIDDVKF